MSILPSRGRPGLSLLMTVERELSAQDLVTLALRGPQAPAPIPVIQTLRASHHTAARLVAEGRARHEIALATGYTAQRIGDLTTRDPAFRELVSYYQTQITEIGTQDSARAQVRLTDIYETALIEMQERMDDPRQRAQIPFGELRQAAAMGLDRTVAPPKTAVPNQAVPTKITFNIGTRDIRNGREENDGREPKDITGENPPLILEHENEDRN